MERYETWTNTPDWCSGARVAQSRKSVSQHHDSDAGCTVQATHMQAGVSRMTSFWRDSNKHEQQALLALTSFLHLYM